MAVCGSGKVGCHEMTAPASRATVLAAGRLMADAVAEWAASPFDVVITFGPYPDGRWVDQ